MRFIHVLVTALCCLFIFATSLQAGPREFIIGSSVKTGVAKSDYHLKITSDAKMTFIGGSAAKGVPPAKTLIGAPTVTGDMSNAISLDWTTAIPAGNTFGYSVQLSQNEFNTYKIKEENFTPPGSPTDAPALGLRVETNGDFFLTNDFSFSIVFDKLSIDLSSAGLSQSQILDLVFDGTTPPGSQSGVILGDSEMLMGNFALSAGEFLTTRMLTAFTTGDSSLTSELVLQHEHQAQVLEPRSWPLLALGIIGVLLANLRSSSRGKIA